MASREPMYIGVPILLLLLTVFPFCATQNTYYVKPTPDTPCHGDPCHTLSEYVSHSEQFLTSNTTMVFLPGEHALQDNITVRNIGRLVFIGNTSCSPTEVSRIICTDATFTFESILMVEITDLGFHSCRIQLKITSVIFKDNTFENSTSKYGGAIYIHNSIVTFDGETRYEDNRAEVAGGGIYADESNLTFHKNTTFINNEALKLGGGIFVLKSTVNFGDSSSFISNSAEYGGGVYVEESNVSFGDSSSFISNSAEYGGGVYVEESTVSFGDSSSFISNSVEDDGGGLTVRGSTASFGNNSSFTSNSAEYDGGGVEVWRSTVSFGDDNSFTSNSAEDDGGGVAVWESSVGFGGSSSFISNSAVDDGGGVAVWESTVSFGDYSSFISNSAVDDGGGVAVWESTVSFGDNSSFISNSAEYMCGGVSVRKSTMSFDDNSKFINNSAWWGGGVCVQESTVSFGDNSSFTSNSGKSNGGGVEIWRSPVSFGDSSSFINNSAEWQGGGVIVWESNVSFGDDSSFISNSAEDDGGGLAVWEGNVSFGDNNSFISNSAAYGGGVYIRESIVSFGDDSSFTSNLAEYNGGGVEVLESNVSFGDDSSFISNSVVDDGGVIVQGSIVSFDDDSSFISNPAAYGGGVFVQESTMSFGDHTIFISNSAEQGGGGVHVEFSIVSFGDDSSFISNSAEDAGGGVVVWESNVSFHDSCSFISNSAEGGGGLEVWHSTVSFGDDSSFISNSAEWWGGGVYVEESNAGFGDNSSFTSNSAEDGGGVGVWHSTVSFGDDSSFTSNSAEDIGGGVIVEESSVSFGEKSSFINNSAAWSGGVFILQGSSVTFGNDSDFTENSASYFGGCVTAEISTLEFGVRSDFMNNSARYGGCIFMKRCNLTLSKANLFSGNSAITTNGGSGDGYIWGSGGAIVGSDSNLVFGGAQELTNNLAGYGGAIYLTYDSTIYLRQNTSMYLKNNSAQYRGGALFVEHNPLTYCILDSHIQAGVHNTCFFQIHEYQAERCHSSYKDDPERLDHSIDLQFQDNTAKETGNILYGGILDSCGVCITTSQSIIGEVAFNMWAKTSNHSLISSDPYRVCLCVDNQPDCNQSRITREVFPGSTLLVPVVALGQLDGIVPAVIQTYPSDSIALDGLQTTQQTNNTCTNLQFTVRTTKDTDMSKEATLTLFAEEPCSVSGFPLEIFVMFRICPPGFILSTEGTCQCEQRLDKYEVECDINDQSILRRDSVWIGFYEQSDNQSQKLILHPHCPFDYCKPETDSVNFTTNNTDLQCNYNRSGHLCGTCTHGYSLAVGSSRCFSCSNKFLALIIPFFFAGLFLVIFLFICKVTVAAGTISGLIFYANIVTANQSVFFPSIGTDCLSVFIAWLNLDFGIETCFFEGMDMYSKTWLQFVFPLYIWLLVGLITVICNVSTTAARVIGTTNPIAVLATLFLLSYTKLLRTFIAAFSFTTLAYPDDETKDVWLYDGNIGYLDKNDGRHIALFLASLLVFLFLFLPYTLLLLFGQYILTRLDPNKLKWLSWANYIRIKSFLDAYHAPYKNRHRYWIGLLLLIRFILFLISATVDIESPQDPHLNLLVIMITSTTISMWVWNASGGVYKKWYLNVLESSFILNLAFFAAATLYVSKVGGNQAAIFYTSVTVAFSTFIGIITYHVFLCLKDSRAWRNIVCKHNKWRRARDNCSQNKDAPADEEMEEVLPTVAPTVTYFDIPTEERREMRPITPPQSPATNVTDNDDPCDTLQKEHAPGDEEIEENIPQSAPMVVHIETPTNEHNIPPITPPPPPINFTDLREPLDLLTQ